VARTAVSIREKDIAGRCINAGAVAHNGGEAGRGKEQDKSSYDQIGERRTSADDKAQRGRLTSKEGKGDEGFVRRHFEHVAPQVEKIVSFRILQIIYLLIVANLQRPWVLFRLNELNQSFSHSLRHLFSGLKREIDEKGAVLDARVHRVLLGGIEGEYF